MPTIKQVVEGYVRLRDHKKELQAQHKEQLAPINEKMEQMEGWLMRELNRENAESVRTEAGTVFKHTRTSSSVSDWDATLAYIIEHNAWHVLERRVSKTAIEEMAENGEEVPGVKLVRDITVQIRRK